MFDEDESSHVGRYNEENICDVMKSEMTQAASSAEHSPPFSEKARLWPWNKYLNESDAGLFTDSATELNGLVEDKEIAARAVAFVVNSTRKGIVPLCADVANLMRSKQILERKLYLLRRESDTYRSSGPGSVPSLSMSPTPPSLSSYTETCIKALQEQSLAIQDQYRSRSRCSNTDSTNSYSPKFDKSRRHLQLGGMQYSPICSHDNRKHGSPRSIHSTHSDFRSAQKQAETGSTVKPVDKSVHKNASQEISNDSITTDSSIAKTNDSKCDVQDENAVTLTNDNDVIVTSAFTFHLEDETGRSKREMTRPDPVNGEADGEETEVGEDKQATVKTLLERRRVSLPEITTVPNRKAIKVRPQLSKQVQCCMDLPEGEDSGQSLEDQFVKSVRLNAKLEEDLNEARKEIENLKKRLKRLEASGAIPKTFHMNDDDDKITDDNGYYTGSNRTSRTGSEHEKTRNTKKPCTKRQAVTPVSYGGPLSNCRCSSCQAAMGSEDDLSPYSDHNTHEPQRFAVNSKLQVQLNDHVMTKGDYSGYIRYIGHMDGTEQANTLYIGLECDTSIGTHDGAYLGKKYFYCKKNHGMFVPLNDVICKVGKKTQMKTIKDEILKLRKHTKRS